MTTTRPPAETQERSVRLREATRQRHERAEGSAFVSKLLEGGYGPTGVYALFAQLLPVYRALEATEPSHRHSLGELLHPGLHRADALTADLEALGAALEPDLRAQLLLPLPATDSYAAVITLLADAPAAFLAHHYTRYLGDLSGGQIMRRRFINAWGIPETALTFFDFSSLGKGKLFKDKYRDLLDAKEFSAAEDATLIAEANRAFDFNTALFTGIEESLAKLNIQ